MQPGWPSRTRNLAPSCDSRDIVTRSDVSSGPAVSMSARPPLTSRSQTLRSKAAGFPPMPILPSSSRRGLPRAFSGQGIKNRTKKDAPIPRLRQRDEVGRQIDAEGVGRSHRQGLHVAARSASDIDDRAAGSGQEPMVYVVCLRQPAVDVELAAGSPVEARSLLRGSGAGYPPITDSRRSDRGCDVTHSSIAAANRLPGTSRATATASPSRSTSRSRASRAQ